jgi:hypothetical protein
MIATQDLMNLLTSALGLEKARDVVNHALSQNRLSFKTTLDAAEAMTVLETVAGEPGLVGATARLAKTRLHLKMASESSAAARRELKP